MIRADARGATPAARRLRLAFAASLFAHAAVLGHAGFGPGRLDASLFPASRTLQVQLAPEPPAGQLVTDTQAAAAEPQPTFHAIPPWNSSEPQARTTGLPMPEIFFSGSEVDERAQPLNQVDLVYPEQAMADRIEGVVTLRLKIDYQGVLREASVVSARPAGVFESAALEAAQGLRFRPALRNGMAVGSVKTIEVPFYPDCRRTGSCVGSSAIETASRP